MKKILAVLCILVLSAAWGAPSWSNILATSRAITWTSAGLPATLIDGETTTNPWTPPTRSTQYGSTINPSGVAATDLWISTRPSPIVRQATMYFLDRAISSFRTWSTPAQTGKIAHYAGADRNRQLSR